MESKDIRLLYVEDEEELVEVMQMLLQERVKELYIARDGEEALESYNKYKPDVMLVDINLPKLSGLEVIEKIRQKDQNVKVILLTAYSDKELLIKAAELKLTKYLIKPIVFDELQEAFKLAVNEIASLKIEYKKIIYLKENCIWNMESRLLTQNNLPIKLTPKETDVLEILLKKQNSVVSYDDIMYNVWEDSDTYNIDILKTTVKSLRRKIPTETIDNVYGVGYKIEI